ncbi:transcriptional regulator [Candidatus Wolbachia massiliensis]|uniref:PAS domain-containing protein n=1 Tax=Candidatus Wolbachia massiliensis TaxID=1845000 RepID=A0A7M3U256_9RICK|nr:PAS domain-containing protein [Candidatus Wolbachia massiliensis]QOD38491.1 PAS domain-containing protein [Candidatus Wolbachia massiliensis]
MFFLYEVVLLLILILFFLSYSKLKVDNKIKSLQHQNIIINNLIDTVDDGFYIWDSKKRIEKFSPNLLILLNTVFYSFNEFVNFFEQSESLIKNFTEAKKINKSFTLDLKSKDGEVYCICHGRSIIDDSNSVIGVLLWIRNISDYKIKANALELENNKLTQEIENYRNIFNSLPFPILKYDENKKAEFCNLFYDKYIHSSQRLAVASRAYSAKSGKHVITYKNERKVFDFIKIPIRNSDGTVMYGKDVSDAEGLRAELDSHLATQKNLLEELPIAIAIYSKNQKLKFYNNAFVKTFQFDTKFLASYPTYHEVMLYLFESKKLLKQEDFHIISTQGHELFKKLFGPHNDTIHLTNGQAFRTLTIPYASEGLLFSYEECKR